MPTTVKELLAAANASVPKITPDVAAALIEDGNILVVDVRDGLELQSTGKIQGATHVTRGMLEFRADPESPYHDKAFDRDKTVLVYCASGGRSALAGKTLQDFGYKDATQTNVRYGPIADIREKTCAKKKDHLAAVSPKSDQRF